MSKTWYPVIDYELCIECGLCSAKCTHRVYDVDKLPTPVVVFPVGCVQGCHGCGNLCPKGAISYVGDNAKDSRSDKEGSTEDFGCGCDCDCTGC